MRALLLRRYGPPDIQIEEGDFALGLATALRTGRFLRVYQWPTSAGVLRFGIPSRPDGIVRIEIRHACDLPPPESADLSLFELRYRGFCATLTGPASRSRVTARGDRDAA